MDISAEFISPASTLTSTPVDERPRAPNVSERTQNTNQTPNQPPTQSRSDTLTLNQSTDEAETEDPIAQFLALGKKSITAEIESEDKITEKSRDFSLPNIAGNPEAVLKKAEEIQRQAQALGGNLTTEEQIAVDKARRIGIQARFELEKTAREEAREVRAAQEEERAARRQDAPNPFRGITTPFDIVEETESAVNLGTSINLQA